MNQDELIKLFTDSDALLKGHFKLTSGRHSDVYYEKFALLRQPALCTRVCREMAERIADSGAETVVGPTTGGVIIAYDVARYLNVESVYAEPGDDGRRFRQGLSLQEGRKVAIVDDVLTTGKSIREVIDLVNRYQAQIVHICLMLDRSNGSVKFDYPLSALATVEARSWAPEECPLCAKGEALTRRGGCKE